MIARGCGAVNPSAQPCAGRAVYATLEEGGPLSRPATMRTRSWPHDWTLRWATLRARLRLDELAIDELDAGLRALAVGTVLVLSLLGYPVTPSPGLGVSIPPALVAGALVVYNAAVVLGLGVPWRRRPGFVLYSVDCAVITGAILLTGGFFSPFLILYYAMVIGAALRLDLLRSLLLVAACAVVFTLLSSLYPTPADTGAIHLPWLVIGVTSLLMAGVTALAMKHAVDLEQARARLEEATAARLRLLNDLTRTVLSASPDTSALLRTVAAMAAEALGADCGLAVLLDAPTGSGPGQQGAEPGGDRRPPQVARSDGAAGRALPDSGGGRPAAADPVA